MSECMKLETKTTWHVCPVNRPLGKARLCTMKIVAKALERQSILSSMLSSLILTLCVFIVHHSQPYFSSLSLENPVHQPIGWFGPYRKEFHRKHYKVLSVSKQGCYIGFSYKRLRRHSTQSTKRCYYFVQSATSCPALLTLVVLPLWPPPSCRHFHGGQGTGTNYFTTSRIKTMHFPLLLLSKLQADHPRFELLTLLLFWEKVRYYDHLCCSLS